MIDVLRAVGVHIFGKYTVRRKNIVAELVVLKSILDMYQWA